MAPFNIPRSVRRIGSASLLCLGLLPSLAAERELQLDYRLNEHVVLVPAGRGGRSMLETTVFQPNGGGPFPLLIINHGKDAGAPGGQARDRFIFMATAFVKRGYAVMVPMRQGFAHSGGRYADHGCDMTANGYAQADDVAAALDFARAQRWIDGARIVVAGQSYGGMATLALGTRALPGVRGLINFAGGLRDDANRCDWRSELVRAFGVYGAGNQIASLWLYGVNDSLFGPALVQRLHQAYVGAGGQARLVAYPAFKRDAHGMVASRDGEQVWGSEVERFLRQIGMPTKELFGVTAAPALPRSDFARIDDVDAVPFLGEHGRQGYRDYLGKMTPRAFAVSPSGAWCWAEEGEDPGGRALATCNQKSDQACQLYSVNDDVVWNARPVVAGVGGAAHALGGGAMGGGAMGGGAIGGGTPRGN
jgi:dienelactone hydrolase